MVNVFRWVFLSFLFLNISYLIWNSLDSSSLGEVQASAEGPRSSSGASISLLSEVSPIELQELNSLGGGQITGVLPVESNEEIPKKQEVSLSLSGPSCSSIGPLANKLEVSKVQARLKSEGLQSSHRMVILDSSEKYRVFLPSYPDRSEAVDVLKKLRAKKIDSYIMSTEGFNNAISLGLFSNSQGAQGLVERMNSFGYRAELKLVKFSKEAYWLEVMVNNNADKIDHSMVNLVAEFEGLSRIDSPCKTIALKQ